MNNNKMEFKSLSAAINGLRFPLILMIVMLHCYSSVKLPAGDHSTFSRFVYPFGLWMGETGVPAFFFISGFLFFFSQKSYVRKIKSRFSTLFVPYVIWNSVILLAYVVLMFLGHPQDIAGKSISDYGITDYLLAYINRGQWDHGNGVPMLCPYWYVRNLMILCLASPVVYYLVKWTKGLVLIALFVWWLSTHHNAMLQSSLLFFSLGAYFSIENINPLTFMKRHSKMCLALWGICSVADYATHTVLGFEGSLIIHRVSLLMNIFAFILIADLCTNKSKFLNNELLSKSSFWIFTIHYPLVIVIRSACVKYFAESSDMWHVLLFFVSVVVITLICLLSYQILMKIWPSFVRITTGNRG